MDYALRLQRITECMNEARRRDNETDPWLREHVGNGNIYRAIALSYTVPNLFAIPTLYTIIKDGYPDVQ